MYWVLGLRVVNCKFQIGSKAHQCLPISVPQGYLTGQECKHDVLSARKFSNYRHTYGLCIYIVYITHAHIHPYVCMYECKYV